MTIEKAKEVIGRRIEFLSKCADNWQERKERRGLQMLVGDIIPKNAVQRRQLRLQLMRRMLWLAERINQKASRQITAYWDEHEFAALRTLESGIGPI
jgi:hypothetical protein